MTEPERHRRVGISVHRGPVARCVVAALVLAVMVAGLTSCTHDHHVFSGRGAGSARITVIGWFMVITSAAISVVFLSLLVWAMLRGGRRPRWSESSVVVAGGIALPAIVIVALTIFTLTTLGTRREPAPFEIEVTGHQYWWEVHYPGAGVTTANEFRIPAGQPVDVVLRSDDVIHSFWLPDLDGKIDMVPGRVNHITLTANKPGTYRGQCAEFCGLQHARMAFQVTASPPGEYRRWVRQQARPARTPDTGSERAGMRAFKVLPCAGCHAIDGVSTPGRNGVRKGRAPGPNLTHLASRSTLAAGMMANDRGHLGGWIGNAQALKPAALMPAVPMSPRQMQNLLDYLESLK